MITIDIESGKLNVVFQAGALPRIDPTNPAFVLRLGGIPIRGSVSAKAARKLAAHSGGAVLQGRLIVQGGGLVLTDAGFTWIDPKPESSRPSPAGQGETVASS